MLLLPVREVMLIDVDEGAGTLGLVETKGAMLTA
jgi:hypothetical protein